MGTGAVAGESSGGPELAADEERRNTGSVRGLMPALSFKSLDDAASVGREAESPVNEGSPGHSGVGN